MSGSTTENRTSTTRWNSTRRSPPASSRAWRATRTTCNPSSAVVNYNRLRNYDGPLDFPLDIQILVIELDQVEVIQPFDFVWRQVRKKQGLEGLHADLSHNRYRIGCEISASSAHMRANH